VTFDVYTAGRRRVVDISMQSGGYRVEIDGVVHHVDAARVGGGWSLLVADGSSPRRSSRQVGVSADAAGGLLVSVDGRIVPVTIQRTDRLEWRRRSSDPGRMADGPAGPHQVTSPMPGRVVKVLAAAGEAVAPRQGLVVVEAMKMENELRAPRAGVVTDVRVSEGSLVEANSILMVIE
jgi:hypothetical protein